ncbi:hypothetical protein KA005_72370, partial [bacterium]|nr:hypothetical protein [bacterium]
MFNRILLFIALITIVLPTHSWATSYDTDATPTVSEVQTLVTNASIGDEIVFLGSATWASAVTVGKALTIKGNGKTLTTSGAMTNGFFRITGFTSASLIRVTGFIFQMTNFTPATAIKVDTMVADNIRIDNNTFHHGKHAILFYNPKGCIDNNYFYNGNLTIEYSAGSNAYAHASWVSMAAGGVDALFVENNHFIGDAAYTAGYTNEQIGTFNGGKIVIRYNDFDSDNHALDGVTYTPFMAHGNALGGAGDATHGYWENDITATGPRRGQSVIEFYENTMHGKRIDFMCILRGSASLVYNNTHTDNTGGIARIYLREEEYSVSSNWEPLRAAWPAEDQVHNTFIWGNTFDDGSAQSSSNIVLVPDDTNGILEDRDFFMHRPATLAEEMSLGIETFTNYNGAAGSHPTDGDPYTDLGTMQFTAAVENAYYGYAEYTHPHP